MARTWETGVPAGYLPASTTVQPSFRAGRSWGAGKCKSLPGDCAGLCLLLGFQAAAPVRSGQGVLSSDVYWGCGFQHLGIPTCLYTIHYACAALFCEIAWAGDTAEEPRLCLQGACHIAGKPSPSHRTENLVLVTITGSMVQRPNLWAFPVFTGPL